MENPYLKVKLVKKGAVMPSKRDEDAGFDLYAVFEEEFFVLKPGDIKMCATGISVEFPQNWVFYIAERGSTGSKGISRRCGVVDSGFRGEIFVPLNNTSNKNILFFKFDDERLNKYLEENNLKKEEVVLYPQSKAIAQGILLYAPHVEIEEVHDLSDSLRGDGMMGSSGK